MKSKIEIIEGDNLEIMKSMPSGNFNLIYLDPPFNTTKMQIGRNGSFEDKFDDFCAWIEPRINEMHRLLSKNGSFFIHMDYREIHYVKVLCDKIFGRQNFQNEIIWQYD